MKKRLALFLAAVMILMTVLPTVFASAATFEVLPDEPDDTPKKTVVVPEVEPGYHFTGIVFDDAQQGMLFYVEGESSEYGLAEGFWVDQTGRRLSKNNPLVAIEASVAGQGLTFPAAYDARSDGLLTPVEDQVGGSCWAHSSVAAMEANAIKKGYATASTVDFSEYYNVWHAKNSYREGVTDPRNDGVTIDAPETNLLGIGGNSDKVGWGVYNFAGPTFESRYSLNATSSAQMYQDMVNTFTFNERFSRDYMVTKIHEIPVTQEDIKNAVLTYGIAELYYYSNGFYYLNEYPGASGKPCVYFYPERKKTNHAVNIIGWDDNFSVSNFEGADNVPQHDGAWLVRNSWGAGWGNGGYFWISYEDQALTYIQAYEVEPIADYENPYFYDGRGAAGTTYASAAANIFVANGEEYLTKVSLGSGDTSYQTSPGAFKNGVYRFSIYKNLPANAADPTAGTLVYTQTGPATGDKYIDVTGRVDLSAGERFSVVFEDLNWFYREGQDYNFGSGADNIMMQAHYTGGEGLSFYLKDGVWTDSSAEYKNVCVRAITKNVSADPNEPHKVTFSCPEGRFSQAVQSAGGTVTLPQTPDHTWVFTYDGAPFDGTGVDRDMTVTAHCYPNAGTQKTGAPCTTEYRCVYCGAEQKDAVTVHSHNASVIAPTEEQPGYTRHTCAVCGDTYLTDLVLAAGATDGGLIGDSFAWQVCDGVLSVDGTGALPDRTADEPSPWQAYAGEITRTVLHEGITHTGAYGFAGLTNMQTLSLPASLLSIDNYGFADANALTAFTAPENLNKIGSYAFNNCTALGTIEFNSALRTLGAYVFTYDNALTEMVIPAGVTSYGDYTYRACPNATRLVVEEGVTRLENYSPYYPTNTGDALNEIVLPASLTKIDRMFYYYNYPAKAVTVAEGNTAYASRDGVLYSKDFTTLYYYPSMKPGVYFKAPETVSEIAGYAFAYQYRLRYLDLSATSITNLTDRTIHKFHSIRNIMLPATLQSMRYQSIFGDNNTQMAAIHVPGSVTLTEARAVCDVTNVKIYADRADSPILAIAQERGYESEVLVDHTHDFADTVYTLNASCQNTGMVIKTCVCGDFICEVTPQAHQKTNPVVTPPTCVSGGYTTYTCSACGQTYQADETPATGIHNYTAEDVKEQALKKAADCTAPAEYYYSCAVCGAVEGNDAHTFTSGATAAHSYTAATVKADALKQAADCHTAATYYYSCAVCGAVERNDAHTFTDGEPTAHNWGWVIDTNADCGNAGVKHEACTKCGDVRNENTAIPATGEHSWKWMVDTNATCKDAGVKHEECEVCHQTRNENTVIPATGEHSYTAQTVKAEALKAAATCMAPAEYYYSCSGCGAVERNDAHTFTSGATAAHSYTAATVKADALKQAADCHTAATYYYSCAVCGAVESNDAHTFTDGEPTAHNWEWVIDTNANCGIAGVKHEACTKCGDVRSENTTIPATGAHDWKWIVDQDATCNSAGVKHEECSVCHQTRNENTVISATGEHSYTAQTVKAEALKAAATCMAPAEYYYSCSGCGAVERNDAHTFTSGATAAHSYTAATVKADALKQAADCHTAATYYYSCAVCGAVEANNAHTFTDGEPTAHRWEWIIDNGATCGNAGVKHEKCTRCGDVRNENTPIPATGEHSWKWIVDRNATCKDAGLKHEECAVCHQTRSENTAIPVTENHTWQWKTDAEPTCGDNGAKHQFCTVCGATQAEGTAIPPTGAHTWNEGSVTKAATCTATGIKHLTCTVCGAEKDETIPKTAHTDANGDGKCDDCGADVNASGKCQYCGETHEGAFGKLIQFFHSILYFFRNLFKK